MYTVMWLRDDKLNIKDMQISDLKEASKIAKEGSVTFEGSVRVIGCDAFGPVYTFKKGEQVFS